MRFLDPGGVGFWLECPPCMRRRKLAWLAMRCPLHRHLMGPASLTGTNETRSASSLREVRDGGCNICMEYWNFLCEAGVDIPALGMLFLSCEDSTEGLRGIRALGAGTGRGTRSRGTGKLQLRLGAYRGSIPHAVGGLPLREVPFGVSLGDGVLNAGPGAWDGS